MSRNGSGVYSLPAGSTAVDNTIIDPVVFNTLISDLETDANTARPVVAGGTGATTAAAARTNLGATAVGASVFTAADAAAARTAIGAPPMPTLATALGQDRSLNSGAGNALIAPSGGQWRVYWQSIIVSTGGVASHGVYVGEGGGTIQNAVAGINHIGFAWRIA
jgi:hypothetical protein